VEALWVGSRGIYLGLERVAAAVPFALAGPRSISDIEIAVRAAGVAVFARNPGQQHIPLRVVARPKAFGIIVVDETVFIVVDAVPTEHALPIAENLDACAAGAAGANARAGPARAIRACSPTDPGCAPSSEHAARSGEGVAARATTARAHEQQQE